MENPHQPSHTLPAGKGTLRETGNRLLPPTILPSWRPSPIPAGPADQED